MYSRFVHPLISVLAFLLLVVLLSSPAGILTGDARPGDRFEVRPADLPLPYATDSVYNLPRRLKRPLNVLPRVPDGFVVNLFAEGLAHARWLAIAPNGDLFVSESQVGQITLLRDLDGDGTADLQTQFAKGFRLPHGLAFQPGALYVADLKGIWRIPYMPGDTEFRGVPEAVTEPGALGRVGGHWTRSLTFAPDGSRFFAAISSAGNIDEEPPPRATVQVFQADGSGQRTFASGLRNPVGIAFHPRTRDLYVTVNERDGMGDELVPDYLTRIREGDFFGWPYAYTGANPQPGFAERRPDLVSHSQVPSTEK